MRWRVKKKLRPISVRIPLNTSQIKTTELASPPTQAPVALPRMTPKSSNAMATRKTNSTILNLRHALVAGINSPLAASVLTSDQLPVCVR